MLHLHYSNRTEALFEALARDLARLRAEKGFWSLPAIIVPTRTMGDWLRHRLAERDGIAFGLETHLLRRFFASRLAPAGRALMTVETLGDAVLTRFVRGDLDGEALAPVRAWLVPSADTAPDERDRRRVALAMRLASLFEEYQFARPKMLVEWEAGRAWVRGESASFRETERWQRELWRGLDRSRLVSWPEAAALPRGEAPQEAVFLFGLSTVGVTFQRLFAEWARATELHVYSLNPCEEFWEDLVTRREGTRRLARLDERAESGEPVPDPFGLSTGEDGPSLLRLWGRPGRESVRVLNELSLCDHQPHFEDPGCATLLCAVQHDLLTHASTPTRLEGGPDGSVRVFKCHGIRREAERIAEEIWASLEADPSLRVHEVGVAVAAHPPEARLDALAAAFEASSRLPFVRLALARAEPASFRQAARLLVQLPLGRFDRSELVAFLGHPALAHRRDDLDREAIADLVARLGIFSGADRTSWKGTYVEGDRYNWDQGLKRLALGQALAVPDPRRIEPYVGRFPEPAGLEATTFVALCRSLLADLTFAGTARLTSRDWGRFLSSLIESYLVPEHGDLEAERANRETLAAIATLSHIPLGGEAVPYRIIHELLVPALDALEEDRLGRLGSGVALGTLQSLRAMPFKVLFVAGLDDASFPARDRRDPLDLRNASPCVGDVSPRERDGYLFLEAILSARDALRLSYVGRQEHTGDELPPSVALTEFMETLDAYLPEGGVAALVEAALLRRHEQITRWSSPAARGEAEAARLPKSLALDTQDTRAASVPLRPLPDRERADARQSARRGEGLRGEGPARRGEGTAEGIRIDKRDLLGFLDCPLQASARRALAVHAEDDDDGSNEDLEPFELPPRHLRRVLWDSFLAELEGSDTYDAIADRAEASGIIPSGLFATGMREAHRALLAEWKARLGRGRCPIERGERSLDLEGFRFQGVSEPVADGRSLVFLGAKDAADRARLRALRVFLDHVLAAACGEETSRGLLYFCAERDKRREATLAPIGVSEAREWLLARARELTGGIHRYFLPVEAVFKRQAGRDKSTSLTGVIDGIVESGTFLASDSGALRFPERYPRLAEDEAARVAAERFGLFFESFAMGGRK